jgi:vacuolar-type H+-ATPase subunit B/Vma2
MQQSIIKFRSFEEAEKADREFYKSLSGQQRLDILVELLSHVPEQKLERVVRIVKFSELKANKRVDDSNL